MAKADRLLAWTALLSSTQSSYQQNYLCDEIEKRFPVKLTRAESGDSIKTISEDNVGFLLSYLSVLEQEEKV